MRITQESDYALRIVTTMALHGDIIGAATISEQTSVTQRFALKILHKLVKGNIISSYKGAKGGYKLALSPKDITLRSVIELIDGPIAIARCVDTTEECSLKCDKTACVFHHIFDSISADIAKRLDNITIFDIITRF